MADDDTPREEPLAPWAEVQKKTFTRWLNVKLAKTGLRINNFSNDLHDGVALNVVLEEISGQKIPKVHKVAKMRIHKTENVGAALAFMTREGLKLTNIGAVDIVDKKTKLILGVVWTIILRYQIQKIDAEGGDAELLQWINKAIPQYKIKNFNDNWKDGKAISALLDYLRPGIIDLSKLSSQDPVTRATIVTERAESELQIPPLLDPNDLVSDADDLSIMTYLSFFQDYDRKHRGVDANTTYAAGPGLEGGVIGGNNDFTVYPKNSFGSQARPDGIPFTVKVTGPDGTENKEVTVNVIKSPDGIFDVSYIVPPNTEEGTYNVQINLKDQAIKGSPFTVDFYVVDPTVLEFSRSTTVDLSALEKEPTQDGDRVFTINPKGVMPDGAKYKVHIVSPDGEEIPSRVILQEDGKYDVKFFPTKDGKHEIVVKVLDQNDKAVRVKGGPYSATIELPVYEYPRIIFPIHPNLGSEAKIVSSEKQPNSVKHVLSKLPPGWKYLVDIKLVSPDGIITEVEGSPFELEKPE